jgi:hypothetical protein
MTIHYHLLIERLEPNAPDGMRQLNRGDANYFNHDHDAVGMFFNHAIQLSMSNTTAILCHSFVTLCCAL